MAKPSAVKPGVIVNKINRLNRLNSLYLFGCFGEFFILNIDVIRLFKVDYKTWKNLHEQLLIEDLENGEQKDLFHYLTSPNKMEKSIDCIDQQNEENNHLDAYTICFIMTHDCNLNCGYCFDKEQRRTQSIPNLSLQQAQSVIEKVMSYYKSITIWFFGGEPLLKIDLIQQIVWFCEGVRERNNEYSFRYTITTNGTLITHDSMAFFTKYRFSMI